MRRKGLRKDGELKFGVAARKGKKSDA